jgi:preprotein translocase SecF subunit
MIQIFKNPNYDFIGKRKYGFIVSSVVILVGIVSLIAHKGPKYGIDFTGGSLIELHFETHIEIAELRDKLSALGVGSAVIQEESGTKYNYLIKTTPKEGIGEEMAAAFSPSPRIEREELVGPSISEGFRAKALWVVFLGMIVMLIYVWIRFSFRWGACAMVAIIHDLMVTVGILSLLDVEFGSSIVAALLAIIGYSINDSIVISDRVRENLRGLRKRMLPEVINTSINQALSRTVLTSLTTLFVLITLLCFGGRVIHDFALTLLIGVIVGTYSSIFVLSSFIVEWEKRSPTTHTHR